MKPFTLCLLIFAAGCFQTAPVEQPKPKTEKKRLTELWAKVEPLEPGRETSPDQLIAALGQPDLRASGPYLVWGTFEAVGKSNYVEPRCVFRVKYRDGKLSMYQKTRPIVLDNSAPRFSDGDEMIWDEDRFVSSSIIWD